MQRDLKEVIGALMRALDGHRLSCAEVEDLSFDAAGELQLVLDRACTVLLEFAYGCADGVTTGAEMRRKLQGALDDIVRCADMSSANV